MTDMRDQILENAQGLIQTSGYNGFSFRDIASNIGIKSSSIHYYYPSKTHLAVAAIAKYRSDFMQVVTQLRSKKKKATTILKSYAGLFQETLECEDRLCLAGMLASELNSVEEEVRTEIKAFFSEQRDFLTDVITEGQSNGEIRAELQAAHFAKTYLAALEGAMMLARTQQDPSDILLVSRQLIASIKT